MHFEHFFRDPFMFDLIFIAAHWRSYRWWSFTPLLHFESTRVSPFYEYFYFTSLTDQISETLMNERALRMYIYITQCTYRSFSTCTVYIYDKR